MWYVKLNCWACCVCRIESGDYALRHNETQVSCVQRDQTPCADSVVSVVVYYVVCATDYCLFFDLIVIHSSTQEV